METKIEFERERDIQGLKISLPEPPPLKEIMNWDLPKEQQKWKPDNLPPMKEFEQLSRDEQRLLIRRELARRENGFWFFNNGNLEYLTGVHYFYLSYWPLPEGLPIWIDADRDFFYFWDACVKDINCYGMVDIENRRGGKTAKATCILYEHASKNKDKKCGIQSKTHNDGRDVFIKLKKSWQKLHPVWKPADTGETNPAQSLRFEEPSKKNTKGEIKKYKEVLNSSIDYRAATEEAYDGLPLHRLLNDEFGKTLEANVSTRWNIQKFCLVNPYANPSIIGKALFTTTVEEMEKKGGKNAKIIWETSDHTAPEANGKTKSGLYRYFKPAYYGHAEHIDEYGYSLIEQAKKALLAERASLEGEQLYSLIRKQPFTIQEAFVITDKSEIFPAYKIQEQIHYNDSLTTPQYRIGNLEWINAEKTEVEFFDNQAGRWKIAWFPHESLRNGWEMKRNGISPTNTHLGLLSLDPFDHKSTVGDRKSNAAMYLFRNFTYDDPLRSGNFVLQYIERPPIPELMYDDIARTCVYYGMEVLIENQKPGTINYFNSNGFSNYVKKTDNAETTKTGKHKLVEGIATSGDWVREQMMNTMVTYCYQNLGKLTPENLAKRGVTDGQIHYGYCPFNELLEQLLDFDVLKWTDYDAVVSASIAVLGVKDLRVIKKSVKKVNLSKWFPGTNTR